MVRSLTRWSESEETRDCFTELIASVLGVACVGARYLLVARSEVADKAQRLGLYGQVTKRAWWMPWQSEAMKDVLTCDKL